MLSVYKELLKCRPLTVERIDTVGVTLSTGFWRVVLKLWMSQSCSCWNWIECGWLLWILWEFLNLRRGLLTPLGSHSFVFWLSFWQDIVSINGLPSEGLTSQTRLDIFPTTTEGKGLHQVFSFFFFFLSNTLSPTSWDWKSICPFISLVSLVSCFRGQLVGSLQIFLQHTSMLCMNQISYILGSIERTLIHARSISPLLTIWLNGAALWQGHLGIRHCPHFFTF